MSVKSKKKKVRGWVLYIDKMSGRPPQRHIRDIALISSLKRNNVQSAFPNIAFKSRGLNKTARASEN